MSQAAPRDLVLVRLDRCQVLLRECQTLDGAKKIAALAEAARVYSKRVNAGVALTNEATALKVKAERRFGEIMAQLPPAKGTRGQLKGKTTSGGVKKTPPEDNDPPSLASLGVDKNIAKRCRLLAKLPEAAIETAAQAATKAQEEKSPAKLVHELTEEIRQQNREAKRTEAAAQIPTLHPAITVGDFRELGDAIPNGSISLILTDPPYGRQHKKLLPALAELATAKLCDGGSFLCYVGGTQMLDALDAFRPRLRYWWTIACLHAGRKTVMREYGVDCGWKAILWFVKGSRIDNTVIIHDVVSGGQEKTHHEWQQAISEAQYLIEKLCPPDGVVLDPCLGSGTTGIAAKRLHRRWIAYEIDETTAKLATGRIGA